MPTRIVGEFVEALEQQDLDAAIDCVDQGVYFVSAAEGADFSGREGFRRWWEQQISNGSDFHPLHIDCLDDHHVFVEMISGHPENGGHTWVAETLGVVYTVDDGRIEAIETFRNAERTLLRARRTIKLLRGDRLFQDR
jgi:limonene-1,2-epoxide hydrolase